MSRWICQLLRYNFTLPNGYQLLSVTSHPPGRYTYPGLVIRLDRMDTDEWFPTNANEALVAEIRAEQAALGLTNDMLALRSDIDSQSVGRYLRCERPVNTVNAWKFAKGLKLPASELTARAEARLARVTAQLAEATAQSEGAAPEDVTPLVIDRRQKGRTREGMNEALRPATEMGEDSGTAEGSDG